MCGIAGIVNLKGGMIDRTALERICGQLAHRGPNDEGYYVNGVAGLGQRRLSIIDLAGGHQPMSNEDGTVWVSFNGEIYNFEELRKSLDGLGHRFRTQSDTEVLVHAYEQYGKDCVKRLRGMFAFAVWDERQHTLFLARDRVGKKPLFYAVAGDEFVFASELQALVRHPRLRREPDFTAIDDYLTYGYIPAPKTPFRGVYKLAPGHHLSLRAGPGEIGAPRYEAESYWQLEYGPKLHLDEEAAAEQLLNLLSEAVRLRLRADVPVGALLSGGIDSGLVVALMSQLSGQPIKTFSIGFQEQDFSELVCARRVAKRYGTDHHELIVRPDALEVLPALVRHYGEPFADSSAVPSYYVAKMTRPHVKIVLNGDGGDECFGGYERYLGNLLADSYQRLPWVLRRGLIEPASRLIPDALPRRNRLRQVKRFLEGARHPFAERYLRWVTYFTPAQKRELYAPEFREHLAGYEGRTWLRTRLEEAHQTGADPLDAVLSVDVGSYLPYDLLVKMDIATMANSLEARSPFLDHKVLEFTARLPREYKIRRLTQKYLLKVVGKKLLPPENVSRRKMGFGVPIADWMRGPMLPLLEDVLLSPQARTRTYLQTDSVRRLVQAHREGEQDYSAHLWALLWLELWFREFTG